MICTFGPCPNRCWRLPMRGTGSCCGGAKIPGMQVPAVHQFARPEYGRSQDTVQWCCMRQEVAIEEVIQNRMPWVKKSETDSPDPVLLLTREWLVANGLGGYASASVSGACTRRYHGLLIAALPAPLGRMVMLSHFGEELVL